LFLAKRDMGRVGDGYLNDMTGSGPPKMGGIPSANHETTSPPNALTAAAMSSPSCCCCCCGGGDRNTCTVSSVLITTSSNYAIDSTATIRAVN
jgi:hypothetical protein